MAISSGTVLKIVASLLLPDASLAQNVFYAVITDLVTSDDDDDVVSDMVDWVEAMFFQIVDEVSSQVASAGLTVYEYDSVDGDWDEVGTTTWDDFFDGSGDMLPHGVAAIVHAYSLDPDVAGRKYIAGLIESVCAESDLTAGAITALGDFGTQWTTPRTGTATGGTIAPGVWSNAQDQFRAFLVDYAVNGVVGYQRRRKPGVGI